MNRAIIVLAVVAVATAVVFMLLFNVLSARYERTAGPAPEAPVAAVQEGTAPAVQPAAAPDTSFGPAPTAEADNVPPAAPGGLLDG